MQPAMTVPELRERIMMSESLRLNDGRRDILALPAEDGAALQRASRNLRPAAQKGLNAPGIELCPSIRFDICFGTFAFPRLFVRSGCGERVEYVCHRGDSRR